MYEISICDDPIDPDRKFGFQIKNFHIPLEMRGTTVLFTSWTLSREEMVTYEKFIMSDMELWGPYTVSFTLNISSATNIILEEEIGEYDVTLSHISSCFTRNMFILY